MKSKNYLPRNDAKLMAWAQNFVTAGTPLENSLGIAPADMSAINAANQALSAAALEFRAAQAALKAASMKKHAAAKALKNSVRPAVKDHQLSPSINDLVRQSLGLPSRDQPAPAPIPMTPASLVATPFADGFNTLRWKHNGNKQGVVYVAQALPGGSGAWHQAGVSTASRFVHANVTPGAPMKYRIHAQHGVQTSLVSSEAGVYGA